MLSRATSRTCATVYETRLLESRTGQSHWRYSVLESCAQWGGFSWDTVVKHFLTVSEGGTEIFSNDRALVSTTIRYSRGHNICISPESPLTLQSSSLDKNKRKTF